MLPSITEEISFFHRSTKQKNRKEKKEDEENHTNLLPFSHKNKAITNKNQ